MSSDGKKKAIIRRFLEHCRHKEELALGFLALDEDVVETLSIPNEIVSVLTEEFSNKDLTESGIAVAGEDGAVVLAPALTRGATVVVLRDPLTQQPYELLTASGCLSLNAVPVFEILRDSRTQHLLEHGNGDLIVAYDIDHVAMLRACGLPAVLAVGLTDLPLEHVQRFSELFGLTTYRRECVSGGENGAGHGDESPCHPEDPLRQMHSQMHERVGDEPPLMTCAEASSADSLAEPIGGQLVFLAWTPLELSSDVPPQLTEVFTYLRQLQRFIGLDVNDIGLWKAEEEAIQRLHFIAERKSAAFFKEAFLESAENIDVGIEPIGKKRSLMSVDSYAMALTRLHECCSGEGGRLSHSPHQTDEAWREVQRLLGQQVIGPLRELALAATSPIERNLLMGFAELSGVFHMQSLVMGVQLSRRIADRRMEGRQLPEDQFKNLMAMADRLIGMAKVTERCNRPPVTIVESRAIGSTNIPRLPDSD